MANLQFKHHHEKLIFGSNEPKIMGILNVTPDSFSDGGDYYSVDNAVAQARRMVAEGASILDVGGESTRPGADEVTLEEELRRVIPVIEALHAELDVAVSIDSSKPEVMLAAVAAGAAMINDVNALRATGAVEAAVACAVPVCLMHMQDSPRSMQNNPVYQDVVTEVNHFLSARAVVCEQAGMAAENILLDPGFGFGKTVEHNLLLLKHLPELVAAGYPVLVGLSRKSMIGALLNLPVGKRLHPSVALAVLAVWQGASVVRVHDVAPTVEAVRMCQAVRSANKM